MEATDIRFFSLGYLTWHFRQISVVWTKVTQCGIIFIFIISAEKYHNEPGFLQTVLV
jgi:hypothetical protein